MDDRPRVSPTMAGRGRSGNRPNPRTARLYGAPDPDPSRPETVWPDRTARPASRYAATPLRRKSKLSTQALTAADIAHKHIPLPAADQRQGRTLQRLRSTPRRPRQNTQGPPRRNSAPALARLPSGRPAATRPASLPLARGGRQAVRERLLTVDEPCLPSQVSTQRAATAVGFGSVQPVADRLSLLPVVKQAGMP